MIDGDVIFAKISPCMENGKIAVVHSLKNGVGFGSTEFHVFRCNQALLNRYLFYYLSQSRFRQEAKSNMTGAVGQRRVPTKYIETCTIPLPPLAEQERIVVKIEELFSILDKGIESLRTAQKQLKVYRQTVLKQAFEGKLTNKNVKDGELPEGWRYRYIYDVCDLLSGCAFKSSDFTTRGIPVIKIANIGYSKFDIKDQQYLPEEFVSKYENFVVNSGDLLIALTRPITNNTTKVCYFPKGQIGLLNQRVACFKEIQCESKYLFYYCNTESFKTYIRSKFTETLQPNLSPIDLKECRIPFPSSRDEEIKISLDKAESLRQSILKKAFEGKLVPQDPSDEPASVLLDRIRAEREKEGAGTAKISVSGKRGRKPRAQAPEKAAAQKTQTDAPKKRGRPRKHPD